MSQTYRSPISHWAEKFKTRPHIVAALLAVTGWPKDKAVTEQEYLSALSNAQNRPLGGK